MSLYTGKEVVPSRCCEGFPEVSKDVRVIELIFTILRIQFDFR